VGQGHGDRGMTTDPMQVRLKYLTGDVDRHGNARFYVRVPGRSKVRIRGVPYSEEFMLAYNAAFVDKPPVPARSAVRGSFRHLCQLYFSSLEFRQLDAKTQKWRRPVLEAISRQYGEEPVARMEARHIRKIVTEGTDKASVPQRRRRSLQALFKWAVENNEAVRNPVRDVTIRYRSKGHHTWTLDEVDAFEKRHSLGSRAHLAMWLMLYTAGRREDAVRLGPQHIKGNRIRFTQAKNEHRSPVPVDIPVHPDLAAAIAATPSGQQTFLVTGEEHPKPFTPNGFTVWFRQRCNEAGLPHCTGHGLRKTAAVCLAECGATPHEIMAVTGHRNLAMVEHYTRAAGRAGLADSAMAKLKSRSPSVPLDA
jgi:integrase/recombinase XerD